MRVAIIGTGVSGLVAAHALHRDHEVTVFEADTRVGGHANTVDVEVGGIIHAVDTGFIVYNEPNYPGFTALLRALGVETQPTEMSFSVTNAGSGLEYRGSNLNTLFAQRRNLTRPSFLRLVTEIVRFNRAARRLVVNEPRWQASERLPATGGDDGASDESIESFLRRGRYSQSFVEQFLVPFGSAIWSADPSTFTRFPDAFVRRGSCTTTACSASQAERNGARSAADLVNMSTGSSRRLPIGSGSGPRCTRSSPTPLTAPLPRSRC